MQIIQCLLRWLSPPFDLLLYILGGYYLLVFALLVLDLLSLTLNIEEFFRAVLKQASIGGLNFPLVHHIGYLL